MAYSLWARAPWPVAALSLVLMLLVSGCQRADDAAPSASFRGMDITGASYGRDFRLRDPDGRERTLADFRGKAVLLYFGFTQCPDVCPTALSRAVEARRLLGPEGERLQVIFVTLDPERDAATVLRDYTAAFDPTFLGLSGDPQATRESADDFKVYYRKVPTGGSYTMDHSTLSYAFDPQGRLRLALRHEQNAQDYAHDLRLLLQGR